MSLIVLLAGKVSSFSSGTCIIEEHLKQPHGGTQSSLPSGMHTIIVPTAERSISSCGGSSRGSSRAPPHPTPPPCARVPPSRHAQPSAEPVGGAQLPSLPPVGGAPQRHHRWLQSSVWAAVKRRDVFSIIMENRNTATAARDEALGVVATTGTVVIRVIQYVPY